MNEIKTTCINGVDLDKFAHHIRRHIIETVINYGEGHAGPSLSSADILAVLYGAVMKYDPKNPQWENRDRFLLSAGHKCLGLYGALVEAGYCDKDVLTTYNKLNSVTPAHPDMYKLPGVEFSTGSLGHGLPLACGMALAAKMKKQSHKIFVLMGDGEHGEGSVWEGAAYASAKGLDNIVAILDNNGLQINGTNAEVLDTSMLYKRYEAFGWGVRHVDGHDVTALYDALIAPAPIPSRPTLIVAKTIKSRGLPFAEGKVSYHHWHPGQEEVSAALRALEENEARWTL